jgi:ethanolamine ammonia-lyase small subunit
LERCGDAQSTASLLEFQLAHAQARDAVHGVADFGGIAAAMPAARVLRVHSAAADRSVYLRRPDLGRRLDEKSRDLLKGEAVSRAYDVAFVIADGLSSAAVNDHAVAMMTACLALLTGWKIAPVVLAEQARVALGDEVCSLLNAELCVVLIGERPGLTVANSLGLYLTWQPSPGVKDSDRNCISNVHGDGLSYQQAATKLVWLMSEARQRRLSGVALKENAAGNEVLIETASASPMLGS